MIISGDAAWALMDATRVGHDRLGPELDSSIGFAITRDAASELVGRPNLRPRKFLTSAFETLLDLPGHDQDWVIVADSASWIARGSINESGLITVRFDDGSYLQFQHSTYKALDVGAALLEPISTAEHAEIEKVLGLLWKAAASDQLTEAQERMILSIAEMLERSHREAEPEKSARADLVGAVRSGLGYLFMTVPAGVIAWNEAIPILQQIGWTRTAGSLLGGG